MEQELQPETEDCDRSELKLLPPGNRFGYRDRMLVPVRAEGVRKEVECDFIANFDYSIVADWSAGADAKSSSTQLDAVEFCESAGAKWQAYEHR